MKTYSYFTIILSLIFFSSCKKKEEFTDKVILNSNYNKTANILEIELTNDTKKNYIVLFSRSFTLKNYSNISKKSLKGQTDYGTVDRISDLNSDYELNAKLKTQLNSTITKEIKKIYENNFHISPNDYDSIHLNLPTAFELDAGKKMILKYSLDKQPKVKGKYKASLVKMRDILNNEHNLNIARYIVLKKTSNYDVYLDDFYIKDSIIVK